MSHKPFGGRTQISLQLHFAHLARLAWIGDGNIADELNIGGLLYGRAAIAVLAG